MILHLRLRNWRAYGELDLELGPGTTFIVASNGVGKTSLILAAAWGVFGDASSVNAAEEIRGDSESASVEVVLRLPESGNITISRTVNRKGQSKLEATLGERVITDQAELRSLMADELGGDPLVLARLTFLAHGGSLESANGEFQLREHLASVFGVTPLLDAAAAADKLVSEAAAAARKLKAGQKTDKAETEKLMAAVTWVDEQLVSTAVDRSDALEAQAAAEEQRRLAEEWDRYRAAQQERRDRLDDLASRAGSFLPGKIAAADVPDELERAEQELNEQLSTAAADLAAARAQLSMIEEAQTQLKGAGAVCPTCLRPLSEHDSDTALQQHNDRLTDLRERSAAAEQVVTSRRAELESLREVLSEVRSLAAPNIPPGDEISPEELEPARTAYEEARTRVQELDQLMAELAAGRRVTEARIGDLAEAERQTAEILALIRQEAVGRAAADAFRATADAITKEQIEPLVAEVGRRWKMIFGAEGLRLSPQGEVTRQIGSRVLPFRSLSGGEKVWALLLTRLLITGASTNAPFVWLDEPLEHLDPRLRRVVAGTLARASDTGGLRQVVVTTYESELARQLMEDVPSASLIYVRGAG
ncbi:MAG TPA: AAA family ATPase [Actinomycetota bacterium]|nr:AAA family ATPase [Actinomycetota bacterium]